MKTTLAIIATTTITAFVALSTASATEPLFSPKAQAVADSLRTVQGNTTDLIDRSLQTGTPRGRDFAASIRRIPGSANGIDLAHAARPSIFAKDPGFEAAWRANAVQGLKVAPLK